MKSAVLGILDQNIYLYFRTIIRPPPDPKPRIRTIKTSKLTSDLNFGT